MTSELATKADLAREISEVRAEMKAEFAAVRAEMKAEFADVRAEMKAELAAVRAEMKALHTKIFIRLGSLQVVLNSLLFVALEYVGR